MLVFLDESGDPGMNVERGASELFVVALVTFKGPAEAQRCDDAIAKHRRSIGVPSGFEFHFSQNSRRQREALLSAISDCDFQTHVFALNKKAAGRLGFTTKAACNWTTKRTGSSEGNSQLTFDRRSTDQARCGSSATSGFSHRTRTIYCNSLTTLRVFQLRR
ncbi:MAG TPA: hypothetical protein VND64_15530 [Pirellulales bacterium]|nr:hypothetical protein [Pirellulales bacterium]